MDTHIYNDEQANFSKEGLATIKAWREDIFLDYGCVDYAFFSKGINMRRTSKDNEVH